MKIKDLEIKRQGFDEQNSYIIMIDNKEILGKTNNFPNTEPIEFSFNGLDFVGLPGGRILVDYNSLRTFVNSQAKIGEPLKEEV